MTKTFTAFANNVSKYAGRPITFLLCIAGVLIWAISGPIFKFSETWQLVINTTTTIITFLMVFLIQNTQNRDNAALQAKLDELIRSSAANDGFIGIETMTDRELERLLAEFDSSQTPFKGTTEKIVQINTTAKEVHLDSVKAKVKAKAKAKVAAAKPASAAKAAPKRK